MSKPNFSDDFKRDAVRQITEREQIDEICRLKRELARVTEERDILKKRPRTSPRKQVDDLFVHRREEGRSAPGPDMRLVWRQRQLDYMVFLSHILSQYCVGDYRKFLADHKITASMSGKGDFSAEGAPERIFSMALRILGVSEKENAHFNATALSKFTNETWELA